MVRTIALGPITGATLWAAGPTPEALVAIRQRSQAPTSVIFVVARTVFTVLSPLAPSIRRPPLLIAST